LPGKAMFMFSVSLSLCSGFSAKRNQRDSEVEQRNPNL
jgi:hypothetical protein